MTAFTGWDLYGSNVASNTIWANPCEHFFWSSGSVSSQGECSSRAFGQEKGQPQLGSLMPKGLSHEVEWSLG
nr:hypothetical protein [Tanacetum cinerariifolium]